MRVSRPSLLESNCFAWKRLLCVAEGRGMSDVDIEFVSSVWSGSQGSGVSR